MPPLLSRVAALFVAKDNSFVAIIAAVGLPLLPFAAISSVSEVTFLHLSLQSFCTDSRRVTHNNNMYSCATSANAAAADNDSGKA